MLTLKESFTYLFYHDLKCSLRLSVGTDWKTHARFLYLFIFMCPLLNSQQIKDPNSLKPSHYQVCINVDVEQNALHGRSSEMPNNSLHCNKPMSVHTVLFRHTNLLSVLLISISHFVCFSAVLKFEVINETTLCDCLKLIKNDALSLV